MASTIKVAVRLRPLDENKGEKWAQGMEIRGRRIILGSRTFDPDATLNTESNQNDVYDQCAPIVESVKNGSNGTILVYGQTGTGKTYTMLGDPKQGTQGVAYRSIDALLAYVTDKVMTGGRCALSLSMLEIYNERITDMLSADQSEVVLFGGFPHSASKIPLASMSAAMSSIGKGLSYRHVSPTAMNERSSRSHVILILHLEEQPEGMEQADISRLFLVDLAGSESLKKSQASGKAVGEAGAINKSLLALKSVVLALSSSGGDGVRAHIPYRDSRLTEMLQDSIGGSARTMFIACISPVGRDVEETKSTLDYASKARTIRNVSNTEKDKMAIRVRSLEVELQKCRNQLFDKIGDRGGVWVSKEEHERFLGLAEELATARTDIATLTRMYEQSQARTSVSDSQVAIYKEAVVVLERDLEAARRSQGGALERLERTTMSLQKRSIDNIDALEGIVTRHWVEEGERFEAFVAESLPQHGHDERRYGPMIQRICSEANEGQAAALGKAEAVHAAAGDEVRRMGAQLSSYVAEFTASLQAHVEEQTRRLSRHVARHVEDAEGALATNADIMRLTVERAPKVSPLPIAHLADAITTDAYNAVATIRPFPGVPGALAEGFTIAKGALRGPITDAYLDTIRDLARPSAASASFSELGGGGNSNSNSNMSAAPSSSSAIASYAYTSAFGERQSMAARLSASTGGGGTNGNSSFGRAPLSSSRLENSVGASGPKLSQGKRGRDTATSDSAAARSPRRVSTQAQRKESSSA